ncbi:hypothetical protein G6011_10144 [Alternaria panax]|uniref:Uncharacterized protein n=1 Tax=Alternaria panax TaxID=48097 RepID=A0AAD4FDF7_9PLEO|nr:hypothetical protein G6011_10144 [Alternaria panax]
MWWSQGLESAIDANVDKAIDKLGSAINQAANTQVDKALEKLGEETTKLYKILEPLLGTAQTAVTAGTIIASGVGFAMAASSLLQTYKVLHGTDATSALMKLGVSIDASLRTAADSLEAINARGSQDKFGKHVYRYVEMMTQHSSPDDYYFVFHPGTDWYPRFNEMNKQYPLPRCAAIFSNFYTMLIYLHVFRKAAGKSARINVLMPAEHWVHLEKPVDLDEILAPIRFHGHKHASGRPYVHVDMPGVPHDVFSDVVNVTKVPQSIGKWTGSNTTGWAVGVPTTAATILGSLLMVGICPPLVWVGIGGIVGSPVTGYFAGAAARDAVYDHMVECEEGDLRKDFSVSNTTS